MTTAEVEFLRARLNADEADARYTHVVDCTHAFVSPEHCQCDCGIPARILREVAVWRRLLLDYKSAPLDAVYGGTERETGFQLALSAALRAKIATYDGNPVTGEPFPPARG